MQAEVDRAEGRRLEEACRAAEAAAMVHFYVSVVLFVIPTFAIFARTDIWSGIRVGAMLPSLCTAVYYHIT